MLKDISLFSIKCFDVFLQLNNIYPCLNTYGTAQRQRRKRTIIFVRIVLKLAHESRVETY